jgi:3-deoxy-D-manno-octulosonic-acid transferase
MRLLYSLAWLLATPLAMAYLLWRSLRQPAYRANWTERFGWHSRRPGSQPLIWLHAVSVGETRAAQPLVKALAAQYPQAHLLITCMTPTGRETARELFAKPLGERFHQAYLPYDQAGAQRRFLKAWRPQVGLLMETELWPNLMAAASEAHVPVALVSARLSQKSLERGLRQRALIIPAAHRLSCVLAQSEGDASRIAQLGRPVEAITGNLKFDNSPEAALLDRGRGWRAHIGRQVVLAASTRDGEETLILDAWQRLAISTPRSHTDTADAAMPLLVIVPRHPQRFDAVVREAEATGLRVARRTALDDPQFDASSIDVLIGDSMGEMDAWYALADVTLMGGSWLPFGSQNLIEPCAVGCPVVLGPSTFNFADAAAGAIAAGAALQVQTIDAAIESALALLRNEPERSAMAKAGSAFAAEHRGATQRTLAALEPMFSVVGQADQLRQDRRTP